MIFQGGRPRRLPFLVFDRPQQAIRQGSLHGAVPESCGRHDGSPTALRRQILSPSSIYVTAGLFALPASISRPCRHIASRPCLPLRRSRSAHGRRVLRQVLFFSPPRRAIPAIPSHLRSPYGFQATGTGGPYLPPFRRRASAADGGSGMAGGLRPPDPLRP